MKKLNMEMEPGDYAKYDAALISLKLEAEALKDPKERAALKEMCRYMRCILTMYQTKTNRTWQLSKMLGIVVQALRVDRHINDAGRKYGFVSALYKDEWPIPLILEAVQPMAGKGFDYQFKGDKEDRPGLKSEYIRYSNCSSAIAGYEAEPIESQPWYTLVTFQPDKERNVKQFTHRGLIARIPYRHEGNLHNLYNRAVRNVMPDSLKPVLDAFFTDYLTTRAVDGLEKLVVHMWTQFGTKTNHTVVPKYTFVGNIAKTNCDEVSYCDDEPIKGKKRNHGFMEKDEAKVYMRQAGKIVKRRKHVTVGDDMFLCMTTPIAEEVQEEVKDDLFDGETNGNCKPDIVKRLGEKVDELQEKILTATKKGKMLRVQALAKAAADLQDGINNICRLRRELKDAEADAEKLMDAEDHGNETDPS